MEFRRISLDATEREGFVNGLKFEIASARCEKIRLLRVDIKEIGEENELRRFYSYVTKTLREMKRKRTIQLFAFPESFEKRSTEAVFLLNKFPESIDLSRENENFLYIVI